MEIASPKMIALKSLVPNEDNPNQMTEKQLNKLCKQILDYGFTEPLMVATRDDGKYDIISGHHRFAACRHLGMSKVPCIVYDGWDDAKKEVAMVRMNVVKGKFNPEKFMKIFDRHAREHGEKIVKDMMGFADEGAFEDIKRQIKSSLPKPVREKVEEAEKEKEISTVDELTKVVSDIMSDFGETVPYDYIHFTHGGKDHIMQRADEELWITLKRFYMGVETEGVDPMQVLKFVFEGWEDIVFKRKRRKMVMVEEDEDEE